MNRAGGVVSRTDLAAPAHPHAHEPDMDALPARTFEPLVAARPEPALFEAAHLGVYGPLIAAIRDELEHFIASHVRLHLAIADRDRFVMTAVAVACPEGAEARRLLLQFMREFKPEQVKRYLVRELIGGLPNAAAIDLSQFAGLVDADARPATDEEGEYRDLIAALSAAPSGPAQRPYRIEIVGRWAEIEAPVASAHAAKATPATPPRETPSTPLAGQRHEFDVEDGDGRRRVVLQSVVPGRRYAVGKGEGCDIRLNGAYTSRRHADLWIEDGAWWVADAGSTNGLRVETRPGPHARGGDAATAGTEPPLRLEEGARLVLSARAEGPAAEYPWLALRAPAHAPARPTPIAVQPPVARPVPPATRPEAVPRTPLTAILPGEATGAARFKVTLMQAGGMRTLELHEATLPVRVGRSRNQTLVVDRRHESVSGQHLEVVALDADGAQVAVHGDNGVLLEGVPHPSGSRFRWAAGETLVLGASVHDDPVCTLVLERVPRP
jgi:pSer/pThr/pTyr-binding forkhead associated (FHA) protein